MREFKVNEKVNHQTYGEGTVVEVEDRVGPYGAKDLPIVRVKFPEHVREVVREEYVNQASTKYIREMSDVYNFTPVSLEEHLV